MEVKEIMTNVKKFTIEHIPREQNTRADVLSKLANMREKGATNPSFRNSYTFPALEKL